MTEPGSGAPTPLQLSNGRLQVLYEISRALPALLDWTQLVEHMMDLVLETVGAERGALFLLGPDGTPLPEVVRGGDHLSVANGLEVSRRILAQATLHGEAILSEDARSDERFTSPSVMLYNIVSFMCVPLRRGDRVLGTLYVDHRSVADLFAPEDLAFLTALADICAVALENSRLHDSLQTEVRQLRRDLAGKYRFGNLLGSSEGMTGLFRLMERVTDTDATVLIEGENGTGKELVARALHLNSRRKESPFVTIDCGSLPPALATSELFGHRKGSFTGAAEDRAGLFEQAHGGTVFLDQVEDLPLELQSHLLRAVQEGELRRIGETAYRKFNWRLIAATRFDLGERVRAGLFREDLYYRLRVVHMRVPSLRDRPGDIALLAHQFLQAARQRHGRGPEGFSREALERMDRHRWPGNVRELQHAVERASLLADGSRVQATDLGLDVEGQDRPPGRSQSRRVFSSGELEDALRQDGGSVSAAARRLGLSRRGLQKMLIRFGIRRLSPDGPTG